VSSERELGVRRTSAQLWQRLKPLARQMRRAPTQAEAALWQRLRDRRLRGVKVRRQHAIERFIVDFYAAQVGVVIEVDGPVHDFSQEHDAVRQEFLESLGLKVLRFHNEHVLHNMDAVLAEIGVWFDRLAPPSPLHQAGEGKGDGGMG
jgi:very-short-patch-repair endonuclease